MIKYLILFLLTLEIVATAQTTNDFNAIIITSEENNISVRVDKNNQLHVNVSQKDILKFQALGLVKYSDFGAKGDGTTDDIDAIAATHAYANKHNLMVNADQKATYYIGGKERTVIMQTTTYFGNAKFIIDDTEIQNRNASIFLVNSKHNPIILHGISSLTRNQPKINASLSGNSLIKVTNSHKKQYIRFGLNQNKGKSQTDIFLVDKKGIVDSNTPIIWDFDQVTEITAMEIDTSILYISGGHFTTIANNAESKYTYYTRNILIQRSNVAVDGLEHHIMEEGEHGAPYSGFITIRNSANVEIKNTILSGHKTYSTIGSAGKPVSMGSYDISVSTSVNISFVNCTQTNDINDRKYWGIIGSNFCKNLVYDQCTLSRFDAHMGVTNATIRNSHLGYMGINAIGNGIFTIENSTIYGRSLVNLRSDYGSTWEGEFIIRNCVFVPTLSGNSSARLIGGFNSGQHDFGYTCYMPQTITIDSLYIDDSNHPEDYRGTAIFQDFNDKMIDSSYQEEFPNIKTKEVILSNVTTASGIKLRLSDNPYLFRNVKIISQ